MYAIFTHFFRKHTLLFPVVFFSIFLSGCGNKGPLIVPDALYKKNLVNSLLINFKNDA
tara:strand:+ start:662 stop:835 length:174 start_codon:yes stop_codon:yes gene_type:complete